MRSRSLVLLVLWGASALLLLSSCADREVALLERLDPDARLELVRFGGDAREAVVVDARHELRFEELGLTARDVLELGVAVDIGDGPAGEGVLFRVFWETETGRQLLHSEHVDPDVPEGEARWVDLRVPVGARVAERSAGPGALVLATLPAGPAVASLRAYWSQPVIARPWLRPRLPDDRPLNVVLISLDTLRADHLSLYGHDRPTSPRIDAWAAGAATFVEVQTPANATLDSHMSVMTSLHPDLHAVNGLRSPLAEGKALQVLDPARVTLAESLRKAGYRTAAFVREIPWTNPAFGFEQGFDSYVAVDQEAGDANRDVVFPWLEEHRGEPFFLFLHYFDIHSDFDELPYGAPPEFLSRFAPEPPPGFTGCGLGSCASQYLLRLTLSGAQLPPAEIEYVRALYDSGIAYTDEQVGRLLDRLRDLGLLERTMVILFADHGEEFQEHGSLLHSQLFQETVRVPLVIGHPSLGVGARIETPVEILDIAPTIVDALGLPPVEGVQGRSLVPLLRGEPLDEAPLFSTNYDGMSYAVRLGRWKLIADLESGVEQLYDLVADPGEGRDRLADEPERAARLRGLLDDWLVDNRDRRARFESAREGPPPKSLVPSDLSRKLLKELGYVE